MSDSFRVFIDPITLIKSRCSRERDNLNFHEKIKALPQYEALLLKLGVLGRVKGHAPKVYLDCKSSGPVQKRYGRLHHRGQPEPTRPWGSLLYWVSYR